MCPLLGVIGSTSPARRRRDGGGKVRRCGLEALEGFPESVLKAARRRVRGVNLLVGPATGPIRRLVGREPEEQRLRAFLDSLPDGARALLIRGEPGIGKTALWRAGIERCDGIRVLVTRPAEEEMPLGLGALVDLLEHARLDTGSLLAEDNPFARGRAVLTALRRLAEDGPIVIAIDDLQWLDHASGRALP